MYHTLLVVMTIAIAFIMGVLAVSLPPEHLYNVMLFQHFFEMMTLTLVVGALLKYLCFGHKCCNCSCKK